MLNKIFIQKNRKLAERLKTARIESGLTQVEACKKLKKPQSYLSKIERGERKIEAVELGDLARVYKKSLNYFLK